MMESDPIASTSTKLAWMGVGVSTIAGIATLRSAPGVTVLATAAGAAWLFLAWVTSRTRVDQEASH